MSTPDRAGWWTFDEDGTGPQIVLVADGGRVADDDEWEAAVGRRPRDDMSENYWEGEDVSKMTDGTITSGRWSYIGQRP